MAVGWLAKVGRLLREEGFDTSPGHRAHHGETALPSCAGSPTGAATPAARKSEVLRINAAKRRLFAALTGPLTWIQRAML